MSELIQLTKADWDNAEQLAVQIVEHRVACRAHGAPPNIVGVIAPYLAGHRAEAVADKEAELAATAAVEARVADAVRTERERIVAKLLSHVPKSKWLMEARLREGLEFAASLIALEPIVSEAISNPQPTPEATT